MLKPTPIMSQKNASPENDTPDFDIAEHMEETAHRQNPAWWDQPPCNEMRPNLSNSLFDTSGI